MKNPTALLVALAWVLFGSSQAAAVRSQAEILPPPSFRPAPGWLTVTTGSTNRSRLAPQVWAITERSNVAALTPFDVFNGLRNLSPRGILLWASTSGRGIPTAV
jgi:hypothetical protein